MGNQLSLSLPIKKYTFEDVQNIYKKKHCESIMINTMDIFEQKCLINGTICASKEEEHINHFIANNKYDINIVIYGKNAYDEDKLLKKYYQLKQLGFKNLYIYLGGMFEWLLLQDIYGNEEFPTNCKENDIMKYKPSLNINRHLFTY